MAIPHATLDDAPRELNDIVLHVTHTSLAASDPPLPSQDISLSPAVDTYNSWNSKHIETSVMQASLEDSNVGTPAAKAQPQKKGINFWLVFLALLITLFLAVLESVSGPRV